MRPAGMHQAGGVRARAILAGAAARAAPSCGSSGAWCCAAPVSACSVAQQPTPSSPPPRVAAAAPAAHAGTARLLGPNLGAALVARCSTCSRPPRHPRFTDLAGCSPPWRPAVNSLRITQPTTQTAQPSRGEISAHKEPSPSIVKPTGPALAAGPRRVRYRGT